MLKDFILMHSNEIADYREIPIPWKCTSNNAELKIISDARLLSPTFDGIVDTIPNPLYRNDISSFFYIDGLPQKQQEDNLYKAFIATILWGGKHNSRPSEKNAFLEIVAANKKDIVCKLKDVYCILSSGKSSISLSMANIQKAYESFCNKNKMDGHNNKIEGVNDGYFTNILYFMGRAINLPFLPLIYDSHMKMAHCDLILDDGEQSLGFYGWSEKYGLRVRQYSTSYIDYCQRMKNYADTIPVSPDVLECSVFNILHPGAQISLVYQSVYNRRQLLQAI